VSPDEHWGENDLWARNILWPTLVAGYKRSKFPCGKASHGVSIRGSSDNGKSVEG